MYAPEPPPPGGPVRDGIHARPRDAILTRALQPGAQIHDQDLAAIANPAIVP